MNCETSASCMADQAGKEYFSFFSRAFLTLNQSFTDFSFTWISTQSITQFNTSDFFHSHLGLAEHLHQWTTPVMQIPILSAKAQTHWLSYDYVLICHSPDQNAAFFLYPAQGRWTFIAFPHYHSKSSISPLKRSTTRYIFVISFNITQISFI